jgi:hypothetical protein
VAVAGILLEGGSRQVGLVMGYHRKKEEDLVEGRRKAVVLPYPYLVVDQHRMAV